MAMQPTITKSNILKGPTKKFPCFNVGGYIINRLAARSAASVTWVDSTIGKELTTQTLLGNVFAISEWLRKQGIGTGSVVGFCSENRLDFAAPILATLAIGATCVTFNPMYTIGELKHTINISKPGLMFCSEKTTTKVAVVSSQLSLPCQLVVFDDVPSKTALLYSDIIKQHVDDGTFQIADVNAKDSVAVILFSSGTTGLPKGVQLTHLNLTCFVDTLMDPRGLLPLTSTDVSLGLVPLFHGYGFGLMLASLAIGFKLIIMSQFKEDHFLETIQNHKVTLLFLVPPLVLILAKHHLVPKYDLSNVRIVRCGAAPLSKDIQLLAQKRIPKADFGQAYGMTELSVACVFSPEKCNKVGSVGLVTGGMDCKVVHLETGETMSAYNEGELCFKGPFVMKGYISNTKATDDTIDKDGWLHTGDIGFYDSQGYLYVVDRIKELIKYKGYQVAPAEVEAILLTHSSVKEAAVIGVPNEEAGELPLAYIVLQPNSDVSGKELEKYVADRVSPQKRLRGGVRFVNDIPKNPSGKILRRDLRALYKSTSKL